MKKYHVHTLAVRMTFDAKKLEDFLNQLQGEVVAIIPNVSPFPTTRVDFVLVIEKEA
jgi:hypothetical protein